ncbi:MAG: excinuclease ABC subunit UvrA [Bacteroidales bacterium]|nr:excinuclease ABC subunit UvrA [Candidatus Cacconaster merdequi]
MQKKEIHIKGARVNNLQNIDLDIPLGKLVVITGISGSGKSSLAFDTLFAEGQRRFAESLSAFARQFLGRMSKPDVDLVSGIPPAIAVQQKVNTRNPRSTVGSTTEIYDHLRLLFAKIGKTYSPVSGREVTCDTAKDVLQYIVSLEKGTIAMILASIKWEEDNKVEKLLSLKESGFTRLCSAKGEAVRIDRVLESIGDYSGEQFLLVDRLTVNDDSDTVSRILDSVQTAFEQGGGYIHLWSEAGMRSFSNLFEADGIKFERPSEYLFSYNNPLGACPVCEGYGKIVGIDEELVIPDKTLSVYEGAVACWRGDMMDKMRMDLVMNAEKFGFPIHKPYIDLTKEQKEILWKGNRYFTGITPFFEWVETQKYKIQYRYMLSRYSGKTVCRECGGSRLRKESLYVKVGGKDIAELMDMPVGELKTFFDNLTLDEYDSRIAERPLREIRSRLQYITEVGLSYLTLSRQSSTISGGESQRISLVSCLGNNLVGSMYILDEPSIGLHERDTQRLIGVLLKLRDLGNTVIVVEHDRNIIEAADQLIDIGPYAGVNGGKVVFQGSMKDGIKDGAASLTLDYLSGRRAIPLPQRRRGWKYFIEVQGAHENNLKNVSVKFPLRCLTVVTGVSGSGKSSLVGDILYPALYRHINQVGGKPGVFKALGGNLDKISQVEFVDQNPIGRSTRSNPVTYLKIYDDIRKLFSEQPYAKMNGYGHSHFSFNIDGGRCPECLGEGVIHIPMQFMADVEMVCESCGGKRFRSDILEVKYQGKDINDVLNMSVEDAVKFFSSQKEALAKRIAEKLQPLMDVGLSYLSLGQGSSSLSGGESQRIKLASFLSKDYSAKGSILFIFDEPTTGLHFYDTEKLLSSFNALLDKGHSIIVVEHNPDVIRASDWVIDLGPDAGDKGGEVVFEGTPDELLRSTTATAEAMRATMNKNLF